MAYTVTFWGTRGSIPTPGVHTARYGGNTPCVAVEGAGGHLVILDAGTGNTAGSICCRRIASSEVVPCRDPQMRTAFPGAKNGLKCGRPWM